jgi:hypothetical protein
VDTRRHTVEVLASSGANLGKLTAAGVESTAGFKLAISEVGYGTVSDHLLDCANP